MSKLPDDVGADTGYTEVTFDGSGTRVRLDEFAAIRNAIESGKATFRCHHVLTGSEMVVRVDRVESIIRVTAGDHALFTESGTRPEWLND